MRKSSLLLYMQKVATGDESYREALCRQLSERLVYVPQMDSARIADGITKVRIVRFADGEKTFVPVFTSEEALVAWSSVCGEAFTAFDILGADLCAMLGDTVGISLDCGAEFEVQLSPEDVRSIATRDPAAESGFEEAVSAVRERPLKSQPGAIDPSALSIADTSENLAPASEAPVDQTVELPVTELEYIGRQPERMTESGTFVIRKQLADRSVPIVRSTKVLVSEVEPEKPTKKRSFLGFLKGQS